VEDIGTDLCILPVDVIGTGLWVLKELTRECYEIGPIYVRGRDL
jgi:hypothetical protein